MTNAPPEMRSGFRFVPAANTAVLIGTYEVFFDNLGFGLLGWPPTWLSFAEPTAEGGRVDPNRLGAAQPLRRHLDGPSLGHPFLFTDTGLSGRASYGVPFAFLASRDGLELTNLVAPVDHRGPRSVNLPELVLRPAPGATVTYIGNLVIHLTGTGSVRHFIRDRADRDLPRIAAAFPWLSALPTERRVAKAPAWPSEAT